MSFRPQLFAHMQGRCFEMTQWIADRAYVYNKVHSLLAVFVAFEVLNDEDKKLGRAKTRQWIRRRDKRGYLDNIVKESAIEDTEYN